MADKDQSQTPEAFLAEYKAMAAKIRSLSRVMVRQLLGSIPDGDSRVEYMTDLETFRNLMISQMAALQEVALQKLGITREEYLKAHTSQLAQIVKDMEDDLGVKGWTAQDDPIFDLKKYAARTKTWRG